MLQMVKVAKQAEALDQRFSALRRLRTPRLLKRIAGELYIDLELLGNEVKVVRALISRGGIARNYLLVFLDEYMRRATGQYRRALLASLLWASNVACVPMGREEDVDSITDDAVSKATRDLKRKRPQAYKAICRAADNAPRFRNESVLEAVEELAKQRSPS